jgi:hypothetical protein
MPITYNPPTIMSLPPYKPPSVPPSVIRHRRPHSQRKSLRKFRIFPYCRRFPTTDAACARFRRSRKIGSRLGPITPIVFTARLAAFKDMLTAAKILHSTRTATILAKFRTLVDGIDAVRPVLVTDPLPILQSFWFHIRASFIGSRQRIVGFFFIILSLFLIFFIFWNFGRLGFS